MSDPINYEVLANKPNGLRLSTGSGERDDYGVLYRITRHEGTVETKVATLNMDEITNSILIDILVHRILISKSNAKQLLRERLERVKLNGCNFLKSWTTTE